MRTHQHISTLAALMLSDKPRVAIDLLADEILESNIAKRASARAISWDCDDLVFLDLDSLRIALYEVEASPLNPPLLCIGVGTVPGMAALSSADCTNIAQELTERLSQIVSSNALLWHKANRALDAEVMDDFQDEIGRMLNHLEDDVNAVMPVPTSIAKVNDAHVYAQSTRAQTLQNETALDHLRADLQARGATTSAFSTPAHASLYLTIGTFLLTLPAVGAALLSYLWLRNGVDKPSQHS